MDPNAALETIRNLFAMGDAESAEEVFEGLDEWLSKGGFLPDDWSRGRQATD